MTIDEFYDIKKKPGEGLCHVRHCRNQKAHGRRLCYKHAKRLWRARHPRKDAYCNCVSHAKERGIPWEITFEDFKRLCDATSYHDAKGQERFALTLDRVDATLGYTVGNVEVVPRSKNSAKSNRERHLPDHIRSMTERNKPECPF